MFSDRALIPKLLLAVGLMALLMARSEGPMNEHHPSISDCREDPERYRGRDIYVSGRVESVASGEAWVLEERTPVRILGAPEGLRVGERASFRGAFVPPDAVRPERSRVHPAYRWKRPFMYVVSVGALGWVLWLLGRRYRVRPGLPAFLPRD